MRMNTRIFGEVEIDDDKLITFSSGIIGFPELTEFALIYDEERGTTAGIRWMQSVQEPSFAIPVMDPLCVQPQYNPEVEDDLLLPLGELNMEDILILVTVTIPKSIQEMSVNLKAPIIIHASNRKACQVITEGDKYPVKYPIYTILQEAKAAAEAEKGGC